MNAEDVLEIVFQGQEQPRGQRKPDSQVIILDDTVEEKAVLEKIKSIGSHRSPIIRAKDTLFEGQKATLKVNDIVVMKDSFTPKTSSSLCAFCGKREMYKTTSQGRPICKTCLAPKPVKRPVRAGRNEQCPCASGKKFKKCCMLVPVPVERSQEECA